MTGVRESKGRGAGSHVLGSALPLMLGALELGDVSAPQPSLLSCRLGPGQAQGCVQPPSLSLSFPVLHPSPPLLPASTKRSICL